jgi:tetratricopeptide (TPR) repeat protein
VDPAIKEQIEAAQSDLSSSLEKSETAAGHLAQRYGNLGKLYHAYDFPDAAVACYTNAHRLAPQEFIWPYYAGRIYQDKGDKAFAVQDLKLARQLRPNEIVVQLSLGQAYLDENHPELAEPQFQSALKIDESSAAAMVGLGKVALSAGKFPEAIKDFEAALALQPQASSIHYNLAMAYRQVGDMRRALDHLQKRGLEKAKIPDPYMQEVQDLRKGRMLLWLRGNEEMHERRFADAVEAYGKMVASDQEDPLARISLGSALAQTGDLEGATKQYTRALSLAPRNDIAHYNLGLVLIERGSEQQAIPEFQAAVSSNPGSEMARFQLANLLMRTGGLRGGTLALQCDPPNCSVT